MPDTSPFTFTVVPFVLARCGQRQDALDVIAAYENYASVGVCSFCLMRPALAALGENERALRLVAAAERQHCFNLTVQFNHPALAGLLSASGAKAIKARIYRRLTQ